MGSQQTQAAKKSIDARLSQLHLELWLAWSVAALLASFMVGYLSSQYLPWRALSLILTLTATMTLILSALLLSHMIYLKSRVGDSGVFRLDQDGLIDKISLLKLGRISLKEIKRLSRLNFLGVDLLCVELARGARVFKATSPVQKFIFQGYLIFFSTKFWLPLNWIDGSRGELFEYWSQLRGERSKTQASELRLRKHPGFQLNVEKISQPQVPPPFSHPPLTPPQFSITPSTPPPLPETVVKSDPSEGVREESVLSKISQFVSLIGGKSRQGPSRAGEGVADEVAKEGCQPSDGPYEPSERSLVFQKIETIRRYVKETGLDRFLCEMYLEQLVWLPNRVENSQPQMGAHWVTKDLDYEELSFRWLEKVFHFAIRKDLNGGEMGRLQVGYQGQIVFALKVEVEIGSLEPVEVEKFIDGSWEEELRSLGAHFRVISLPTLNQTSQVESETRVEGNGSEQLDEQAEEQTEEQTSLTGLKRRFGL